MKSVQKIDLGLTGYDELFMNDAERKENKLPRIYAPIGMEHSDLELGEH